MSEISTAARDQQPQAEDDDDDDSSSSSSWQNVVASSLKSNLESDATKERESADELPSPIPHQHQHQHRQQQNPSPATTLFPPLSRQRQQQQQQVAPDPPPWTRWSVEARLAETLLPVEKRQREERKIVQDEAHRFAMHLPKSPQFNLLASPSFLTTTSDLPDRRPPYALSNKKSSNNNNDNMYNNDNLTSTPPTRSSNQHQQQQQMSSVTCEAENYLLRERVTSLEEQLGFFRAQLDVHFHRRMNPARRRHLVFLAAVMSAEARRRVAAKFLNKWQRFSMQRRSDASVKNARDAAGKEIFETSLQRDLIQQEMDVLRKRLNDEKARNTALMQEREELLMQNPVVSPSPRVRSEKNLRLSTGVPSPYSKINQDVYASVRRGAVGAGAAASGGGGGDDHLCNNDRDADEQERQILEKRIEQLSLRCMDQDEVIRTLFVELAAVGKELESQRHNVYEHNIPQFYTTADAASMLLRQSVDPNVEHNQVQSVVSPWPRLSTMNQANTSRGGDIGCLNRRLSQQQQQQIPSSGLEAGVNEAVSVARLLDAEDRERSLLQSEAVFTSTMLSSRKAGSPFEL